MDALSPPVVPAIATKRAVRLSRLGDEVLARLAGGGGERAFAALYERYHQPLYRYCRSILRDDADAQDALQSTFAAALSALRRGRRDAPLRPWLFRIAHNESISLVRRRRSSSSVSAELLIAGVGSGQAPSAAERAAERARLQMLLADLAELPDRARSALLMRELNGLSHEEISVALETSLGAAKQAIFDARRALAELAKGRSMACEDIQRTISDGDGRALRGRRARAHLRDCNRCAAFAAAIPARRSELRALAPALAPAASAAVFAHTMRTTASVGGSGGAAGAGAAAVGKTVVASAVSKALVVSAVAVTAAASVGGVAVAVHLATARRVARPAQELRAPATRPVSGGHRVGGVSFAGRPLAGARGHGNGVSHAAGRRSRSSSSVAKKTSGRSAPGATAAHGRGAGAGAGSASHGRGSSAAAPNIRVRSGVATAGKSSGGGGGRTGGRGATQRSTSAGGRGHSARGVGNGHAAAGAPASGSAGGAKQSAPLHAAYK